ncbi:unnamed protein product [Ixodes pacificus]
MVESAVKTAKSLLKKALESGHDPQLSFLDHRNTPCQSRKASPAQLLMGRRTRTTLPTTNALLKPRTLNRQTEWKNKTRRMQDYYNKTARELPTLKKGDTVRVQPFTPGSQCEKGTVMEPVTTTGPVCSKLVNSNRANGPRSYNVNIYGKTLRRNRVCIYHKFLRLAKRQQAQ